LILLLFIIMTFLLANVVIYGAIFMSAAALVAALGMLSVPGRRKWLGWTIAAALTVAASIMVPILVNASRHDDRATLVAEDVPLAGPTFTIRHLALLYEARVIENQYSWPHKSRTDNLRQWFGLLLNGSVESILIGRPPAASSGSSRFPDQMAPATKMVRYRIHRLPWCPLFYEDARPSFDQLTRMAEGKCISRDSATLADADAVVVMEFLPYDGPLGHPDVAVQANRFSLLQAVGSAWRPVYRETTVGGADVVPPLMIIDGGSLLGMRLMLNFKRTNISEPDPDVKMARLGLASNIVPKPTENERRDLVRRILTDPTIPRDSAQSQFQAAYVMNGEWKVKDLDLVAAILRDQRIVYFTYDTPREATPPVLALPLAERMLRTDVSPSIIPAVLSWNKAAIRVMVDLFGQLPACASLVARDLIDEAARDPGRRTELQAAKSKVANDVGNKACSG
jgi:hypothetical protein